MAKIIPFCGTSRIDINPDTVLEKAIGQMQGVVIIGFDKDGQEYFASSYADGGDVLWLVERLKMKLLTMHHN